MKRGSSIPIYPGTDQLEAGKQSCSVGHLPKKSISENIHALRRRSKDVSAAHPSRTLEKLAQDQLFSH